MQLVTVWRRRLQSVCAWTEGGRSRSVVILICFHLLRAGLRLSLPLNDIFAFNTFFLSTTTVSPFCSSVLEPNFHLCFSQIQQGAKLQALSFCNVLAHVESLFQTAALQPRENWTAPRSTGIGRAHARSDRPLVGRFLTVGIMALNCLIYDKKHVQLLDEVEQCHDLQLTRR